MFVLILQEHFAMELAAKLQIFRCIEPTYLVSRMLVLPHQFSALSLTSNIVPYM
jgi:hypothetical protein